RVAGRAVVAVGRVGGRLGAQGRRVGQGAAVGEARRDVDDDRVGVGGVVGEAGGRAVDLVVDRVEAAAGRAGDVAGAGRDRVGNRVAGAVGGAEVLDLDREGLVGAGGAGVGGGRLGDLEVGRAVDGRRRGGAVVSGGRVAGRLRAQGGRVRERAAVGEVGADVDDDRVAVGGAVDEAARAAADDAGAQGAAGACGDEAGARRDGVG